jgi:CHASE1-domain containing sensor protein
LPLAVRIPSRESLAQRVVVLVLLLAAGSGLASLIARLRKRRRERLTPAPDLPLL